MELTHCSGSEARERRAGGREAFVLRSWEVGGAFIETEKLG